jgi:hypothetical protein
MKHAVNKTLFCFTINNSCLTVFFLVHSYIKNTLFEILGYVSLKKKVCSSYKISQV